MTFIISCLSKTAAYKAVTRISSHNYSLNMQLYLHNKISENKYSNDSSAYPWVIDFLGFLMIFPSPALSIFYLYQKCLDFGSEKKYKNK